MLITLWGFFYFLVVGYFGFVVVPKVRIWWQKKKNDKLNQSHATKTSSSPSLIQYFFPTDIFVLILITISTLLLIFPEFFYLKDIYPAHYRANTMFKLGYQAFMMLGLVTGYILFRIKHRVSSGRSIWYYAYTILFIPLPRAPSGSGPESAPKTRLEEVHEPLVAQRTSGAPMPLDEFAVEAIRVLGQVGLPVRLKL